MAYVPERHTSSCFKKCSKIFWSDLERDEEGKPQTVCYEAVNAMLLNEFLKEHRKNEKQEATITELKAQVLTPAAKIKEQDARIERVNDKIELSQSGTQTVANNQ